MTTTRTTHCTDCSRKLNSSNTEPSNRTLCVDCFDYAGWENTHDDEGHDLSEPFEGCRVCANDVPKAPAAKAGHTKGIAKTNTSHAGHDHHATKAARAACRKARDIKA